MTCQVFYTTVIDLYRCIVSLLRRPSGREPPLQQGLTYLHGIEETSCAKLGEDAQVLLHNASMWI